MVDMGEKAKRQDIGICRNCEYFKEVNDPKANDGKWHWGVGFICTCHGKWVPWRKENPESAAATVEEFETSHIYYAGRSGKCIQHPEEPIIVKKDQ